MSSGKEHLTDKDSPFKEGDSIEKLQRLTLQAVAEGYKDGDELHISIPVEENMTYWGTGVWHVTEEGHMIRANELFSELLSTAVESNVKVRGFVSTINTETGELDSALMAVVTG